MSHSIQDSPLLHLQTCVRHLVVSQSDAVPQFRVLSRAKAIHQCTIITMVEALTRIESCVEDLFASPSIIPNLENSTFLSSIILVLHGMTHDVFLQIGQTDLISTRILFAVPPSSHQATATRRARVGESTPALALHLLCRRISALFSAHALHSSPLSCLCGADESYDSNLSVQGVCRPLQGSDEVSMCPPRSVGRRRQ